MQMTEKLVKEIKARYRPGTRIKCIHMGDDFPCNQPVPDGSVGFVVKVDDTGTIHMQWENGSSLGLIVGEDQFEVIPA